MWSVFFYEKHKIDYENRTLNSPREDKYLNVINGQKNEHRIMIIDIKNKELAFKLELL